MIGGTTAIARTQEPAPIRWLRKKGCLQGRVLDHGCGRQTWEGMEGYDPHWGPEMPPGTFDTIVSCYVCNVVPEETAREIIEEIRSILRPDGRAYIIVRRDLPREGKAGRGTWQRYVTLNELFPESTQWPYPFWSVIAERSDFAIYRVEGEIDYGEGGQS